MEQRLIMDFDRFDVMMYSTVPSSIFCYVSTHFPLSVSVYHYTVQQVSDLVAFSLCLTSRTIW